MKQRTQYKHAFGNRLAKIYRLKNGKINFFSPTLGKWDYSLVGIKEFNSNSAGQLKPVTCDEARKIEPKAFRK